MSDSRRFDTPRVVFIASDVRSGSTLLDLVLGGGPEIFPVGEIQNLGDYLRQEGYGRGFDWACTCGTALARCPFWLDVGRAWSEQTGRSFEKIRTTTSNLRYRFGRLRWADERLRSSAASFAARESEVARNVWGLFDVIGETTGKPVIVDSSKCAEQARFLAYVRRSSFYMVHLVRDGRGVTHSKMRRDRVLLERGALSWLRANLKIKHVFDGLEDSHRMRLGYEDFCSNPQKAVDSIAEMIGVAPWKASLDKSGRHNVGGSPHRFDSDSSEIRVDERWREAFGPLRRLRFALTAGWLQKLVL